MGLWKKSSGKNIKYSECFDFLKRLLQKLLKPSNLGQIYQNDLNNESNFPGRSGPWIIFPSEISK